MWRIADRFWALMGRGFIKPVALAGVLALMLFEGYQLSGSKDDSLGFMRRNLADRVCTKVVQDIPKFQGVPSIAVLDMAGDETGFVTELLQEKIGASGEYRMVDPSFLGKLLREFGQEKRPVSTLGEAVSLARKLGVDFVIFGEVPSFAARENDATLRLELRMAERATGQAVYVRSYDEEIGGSLILSTRWRARLADSSKGRRVFIWIGFTLLLPLLAIPLIRRVTSAESNLINLALLAVFTLMDMFVALFLTGFWIPTIWTALVLLLALAAGGYYNYRITSFIEEMRH